MHPHPLLPGFDGLIKSENMAILREPNDPRHIACLDVPDFYAALEELRRPELVKRPLALAEPGPRAAVQGVNPAARSEGVREGIPLNQALRLCRRLQVVPPDYRFYRERHRDIVQQLDRYSPLVEGPLPGHYFVDLTGTERLWGPSPDVACRMERHLARGMRLHARVGIARNKLVSQVAATCITPGDMGLIFPGAETSFLDPLSVTLLPGVGPKTASRLADFNIQSVGQLAGLAPEIIASVFGSAGYRLSRIARGIDPTPVMPLQKMAKLSIVRTLDRDEIDRDRLEAFLFHQVEEAGWNLRRHNRFPRHFSLEIRYADGVSASSRHRLPPVTAHVDLCLFRVILPFFRQLFHRRVAVRRMALELFDFSMPMRQMSLFPWEEASYQEDLKLQKALDGIRTRFGESAIQWGRVRLNL